jgi:hypothetical protein
MFAAHKAAGGLKLVFIAKWNWLRENLQNALQDR